jgi:transposase InsO family protein
MRGISDTMPALAAIAPFAGLNGAVFHSEHGAQHVSRQFATLCAELGVTHSIGAVGNSDDNAGYESFHASLKRETLQGRRRWPGVRETRLAVFRDHPL